MRLRACERAITSNDSVRFALGCSLLGAALIAGSLWFGRLVRVPVSYDLIRVGAAIVAVSALGAMAFVLSARPHWRRGSRVSVVVACLGVLTEAAWVGAGVELLFSMSRWAPNGRGATRAMLLTNTVIFVAAKALIVVGAAQFCRAAAHRHRWLWSGALISLAAASTAYVARGTGWTLFDHIRGVYTAFPVLQEVARVADGLSSITLGVMFIVARRRVLYSEPSSCGRCGYIKGELERCPECGAVVSRT